MEDLNHEAKLLSKKYYSKILCMELNWKRGICVALAVCTLIVCVAAAPAHNRDVRYADDIYLWRFSASAGLNSDGWEWDAGISFVPFEYVSVKFAIGMAGEIEPVSNWDLGWIFDDDGYYDDYYGYDDDTYYTSRFKFMPSIEFKSPALVRWKSQDGTFHLFANPGVILSPGASGSRGANCCTWQIRGGVELDIDRLGLQAGYGYSTFSLYSGRPYSSLDLPDNPDRGTHSGFVSIFWRF